ncbi:MAG: type II secretion system protein [Candidatus Taylorbacteria bacterium]|nr:type II secretion system protein [Candidatus Taylorbacteria bacterium]
MKTEHKIGEPFLKAKSYKLKACSGFTIIETLVAISILLLSITGPLTIAEKGLASAEAARSEITAFYLAQEAIEYIRNVRDSNAIAGRGGKQNWLQGLNQCLGIPDIDSGCGIDPTANSGQQVQQCSQVSNDNCALYQYNGINVNLTGLLGHRSTTGWQKTDFMRKVYIQEVTEDVEVKVSVTMQWIAGSLGPRKITVSENMLNWYESP